MRTVIENIGSGCEVGADRKPRTPGKNSEERTRQIGRQSKKTLETCSR